LDPVFLLVSDGLIVVISYIYDLAKRYLYDKIRACKEFSLFKTSEPQGNVAGLMHFILKLNEPAQEEQKKILAVFRVKR